MKYKRLNSFVAISTAVIIIAIGIVFIVSPTFVNNASRAFELIRSGNSKDLVILYGQIHTYDSIFAGFTNIIQTLAVVFDNSTARAACTEFFGPVAGKSVLFLSGAISIFMAYGIGYGIKVILCKINSIKQLFARIPEIKGKLEIVLLLLAFNANMINLPFISLFLYIMGLLEVDFKKVILISSIALLLI